MRKPRNERFFFAPKNKDFKEYHYLIEEFDIDDNHTIRFVDNQKQYQLLDINGGGNSACGEPFLGFLEQHFDGQAYVLTSHKTFSSATLLTSWLDTIKADIKVDSEQALDKVREVLR